jgi:hypothetical protein
VKLAAVSDEWLERGLEWAWAKRAPMKLKPVEKEEVSESYACCFCGETIRRDDSGAVHFAVTNLWGLSRVAQGLQAHSACASRAITASPFDPETLTD